LLCLNDSMCCTSFLLLRINLYSITCFHLSVKKDNDFDTIVVVKLQRSEFLHSLPCNPPRQHIVVICRSDYTSNDQGPATEDGIIAIRKAQRFQIFE
jgi:hypothetical protein